MMIEISKDDLKEIIECMDYMGAKASNNNKTSKANYYWNLMEKLERQLKNN